MSTIEEIERKFNAEFPDLVLSFEERAAPHPRIVVSSASHPSGIPLNVNVMADEAGEFTEHQLAIALASWRVAWDAGPPESMLSDAA